MSVAGVEARLRPNVLFVLCDDLGFGDLGVTWQRRRAELGLPAFETPNVDALAAQGALLTNHSSGAPVCAPARANLLTGQHQGTCAVRDNMFDVALPGDVPSIADIFRAAGYRCAAFGKWGLAGRDGRPGHPLRRGFDEFFGYLDHVPAHYHVVGQRAPGNEPLLFEGLDPIPSAHFGLSYSPDLFTARAKRFVTENAAVGQPWFVYLAFDTPHAQLELPSTPYPPGGGCNGGLRWTGPEGVPRWVNANGGRYDSHLDGGDPSWPEAARRHATIVRRIDHAVGDLMALLADLGIADDTVVVFTSDNGPHGEGSQRFGEQDPGFFESWGAYDGMKRDVLQGGHVVPTVVWGPGRVAPGLVVDSPSAFCDWLATFAQWTGQPVPATCDGLSLAPMLAGDKPVPVGRVLYTEYGGPDMGLRNDEILARRGLEPGARWQQQAVQVDDLVAVRYDIRDADSRLFLFDVRTDPAQADDLAGRPEYAGEVARMGRLMLTSRRRRVADGPPERPYDDAWLPALPGSVQTAAGLLSHARPAPGSMPWLPRGAGCTECRPPHEVERALSPVGPGQFAEWAGLLRAPAGGRYELVLIGTAEVAVWLHDTRHLDPVELAGGPARVIVPLAPGWHPIRVVARAVGVQPGDLRLHWRRPGADTLTEVPDYALAYPVGTSSRAAVLFSAPRCNCHVAS